MLPFEGGTSQVAIALLQALLFWPGFVEQSCNVAASFSINSATMLPPFSPCSNMMLPLLV